MTILPVIDFAGLVAGFLSGIEGIDSLANKRASFMSLKRIRAVLTALTLYAYGFQFWGYRPWLRGFLFIVVQHLPD